MEPIHNMWLSNSHKVKNLVDNIIRDHIKRRWLTFVPEELEDVFFCSAAEVATAAAAGCFLETMSMTVEAIEEPPSGLRRDPLEAARDPPAKNGFFSGSGLTGSVGPAASVAGASAWGGFSFS